MFMITFPRVGRKYDFSDGLRFFSGLLPGGMYLLVSGAFEGT